MIFLVSPLQHFNPNHIYYNTAKNNINTNVTFTRIYYSTPMVALNAVYLQFSLTKTRMEPYFNKLKCVFDISQNLPIIGKLNEIETHILKHYMDLTNSQKILKLTEQLKEGNIKINISPTKHHWMEKVEIVLKISGVWKTNNEYGLTYHFYTIG